MSDHRFDHLPFHKVRDILDACEDEGTYSATKHTVFIGPKEGDKGPARWISLRSTPEGLEVMGMLADCPLPFATVPWSELEPRARADEGTPSDG